MDIVWYVVAFILGTIIGSFLNVVLYRLHTGKSLQGRSHCMSCGKTLSAHELVPIFSYLILRGRCKGCGAFIPPRYLYVELLTGLSFLLVWHLFAPSGVLLLFYAALFSFLILITVYDIRHTIIPDELTAFVGALAFIALCYELWETHDFTLTLSRLLAGLSAAFFFWGLWRISHGRWIGLGDAKLALPLGILVGIGGVFSMVVLSFWVGAIISLALLGLKRFFQKGKTRLRFLSGPRTIKSEVPFAPFLVSGFLLVHLFHADIFDIVYTLFFWWQ